MSLTGVHQRSSPFVYWGIQVGKEAAILFSELSEETRRSLTLAAACTGGLAVLLAPASVVTLAIGVAVGYGGKEYIGRLLEGGGRV